MNVVFEVTGWMLAQASPPGTVPNPTAQLVQMLGTFLILGVMFYFMMIRPQQKKAREHAILLSSLRPGDKVTTTGGLVAVVVNVKDKSVSVRSADSKLELLKSAIAEVTERSSASNEA